MPRPKPELPAASAIRALADDAGRLALRVTPAARTESMTIAAEGLQVKVRARPADGAANAAVIALLARALGLPTSRLRLLRGATARDKVVQLGPDP